jgi:Uma2 family endonuclease
MTTTLAAEADLITLAELLERLGGVPAERVRLRHPLGSATEEEYVRFAERTGRGCELIDGVIVEKAIGYFESRLAAVLLRVLGNFLVANPVGFVLAPDGMVRVEGQVRMPDAAFYPWSAFPSRRLPRAAILAATPTLVVEVISPSNTEGEMERKRRECFLAGTLLFWQVYPDERRVRVYVDPVTYTDHGEDSTLEGAPAIPGFTLTLRDWLDEAGERDPA